LLTAAPAAAQDTWPSRPLRIIAPAPPGTAPDIFGRLFAEQLTKILGQPVTVDNRPGASAILGTELAAKAPADGHTLLYGFNSIVTMNPHLFSKLPYDAQRDLAPVTQILAGGFVVIANNDFPARDLRAALEQARARPSQVSYGSYGPGSASDLGFKLIEESAKVDFLHVPYKQGVTNDVIGGVLNLTMEPTGFILPFIQAGKVRPLAVTTPRRIALLPEVPTVAESFPGFEVGGWHAFFVPGGTPPAIVARLNAAIRQVLATPEMQKRVSDIGFTPTGTTPEELATIIRRESDTWGRIIRAKNIKLD
jgi:tripartite-type tricarboxylate transporter receptor subunit TctC